MLDLFCRRGSSSWDNRIRTVFYNDLPPSYGHGPRVWSCQGRCPARTFTVTHLSHRTDHCGLASSTILRRADCALDICAVTSLGFILSSLDIILLAPAQSSDSNHSYSVLFHFMMKTKRGRHKEERIEYRNHNLYDEPPLPTPSLPSLDRYRTITARSVVCAVHYNYMCDYWMWGPITQEHIFIYSSCTNTIIF
ncbi:hypothetical protein J6590_046387 [Homalodisca vitripennis]|nr:hypothetical protein J6590_046387 [Homalodisca vitripennis]